MAISKADIQEMERLQCILTTNTPRLTSAYTYQYCTKVKTEKFLTCILICFYMASPYILLWLSPAHSLSHSLMVPSSYKAFHS